MVSLKKEKSQKNPYRISKFSPNLITFHDAKAPASEAYRSLRTNIGFLGIDQKIKSLVVTSPDMGEGKSTTVANLAVTMANAGKKVLLMEGDLRNPKVHRFFRVPNDVGLTHMMTDMILDDQNSEELVKEVQGIENLYLMTNGFIPPNPTELLSLQKMERLLRQLESEYDMVLIDTPPVGQLTDAAILGKMANGVLLVIDSGRTSIEAGKRAKQALLNVDAKILGVVLTKIDKTTGGYYYYKYYNYNYRYGDDEE